MILSKCTDSLLPFRFSTNIDMSLIAVAVDDAILFLSDHNTLVQKMMFRMRQCHC